MARVYNNLGSHSFTCHPHSGAGTTGHGGHVPPPPLFQMAGHGGDTVEERLITIIYCDMPIINAKNEEWRNPLISIW